MSYAPGGWGAFLALSRDPANRSQWLAGADVGGLFVSVDDGVSWQSCNAAFGFQRRLSNHNVVSLAVDARGRVCAATNGDGYQCVQIKAPKDNFAEKSLSI